MILFAADLVIKSMFIHIQHSSSGRQITFGLFLWSQGWWTLLIYNLVILLKNFFFFFRTGKIQLLRFKQEPKLLQLLAALYRQNTRGAVLTAAGITGDYLVECDILKYIPIFVLVHLIIAADSPFPLFWFLSSGCYSCFHVVKPYQAGHYIIHPEFVSESLY